MITNKNNTITLSCQMIEDAYKYPSKPKFFITIDKKTTVSSPNAYFKKSKVVVYEKTFDSKMVFFLYMFKYILIQLIC
jgi:hypothetical protein